MSSHPLLNYYKYYPVLGNPDFLIESPLGLNSTVSIFTSQETIQERSRQKLLSPPDCIKLTNLIDVSYAMARGFPIIEAHYTERVERDLTFVASKHPAHRLAGVVGQEAYPLFLDLVRKVMPDRNPETLRIAGNISGFQLGIDPWPKQRQYFSVKRINRRRNEILR